MGSNALPLRLYRHPLSGHAHRVALFLSLLGLPYEAVDVDLAAGAHKRPEFLSKNPFGQVPVLEDGDLALADSNAILVYLALRYDPERRWYPTDALTAARIQRWLSVAAGELAAGPATARLVKLLSVAADHDRARNIANHLFGLLDRSLAAQAFLAAAQPTIADVALYSYTAHAPEGGVSLEPYPNVTAWLRRIEALPRFVPMQRSAVPAAQPSAA
jgi:glutathione S-transferase